MSKILIIFTEGDTDYIFFKNVVDFIIEKNGRPKSKIIHINVKGVGKFSTKVPAKYKNYIKHRYPKSKHNIFLAYDLDVFELKQKPPVDWNSVEVKLKNLGANSITHLQADRMIEDWFIYDVEGICNNLKLKIPNKIKGKTGLQKIQYLFKRANRIYQKGYNSNNFINSLDIGKIFPNINELGILEQSLY